MKLKTYKPTSNGVRHKISLCKNLLAKNNRLIKNIIIKKKYFAGRSRINGRITSWHRGAGQKKLYRLINFSNGRYNSIIVNTTYDPYRKSFIALHFNLDTKEFFYSLANDNVLTGALIKNSKNINELKLGFRTNLRSIPTGSIISNLGKNISFTSQYIKAAGTFGQLIQKSTETAKIKLPSKKIIEVSTNSFANLGMISNIKNNQIVKGKAGTSRHLGVRPTVRGIAMNPVDHPHGGRTNGGRPSVTPWGLPTKGGFYLRKKRK